jgi:hypothetical protein
MTKQIVWIAATVALLSRGGVPDITGDWSVVAIFDRASGRHNSERRVELVCAFEQHDATLTGSCHPPDAPAGAPLAGTAHERDIEWSFEVAPDQSSQKGTATFRGALDANGLVSNGRFTFGDSHGEFHATRR